MVIFLSIQVQTSGLHSHPHISPWVRIMFTCPGALIQQSLQAFMTLEVSAGYPGLSWLGCFGRKEDSLEHRPANRDSLGAAGTSLACAPISDTPRTEEAGELI